MPQFDTLQHFFARALSLYSTFDSRPSSTLIPTTLRSFTPSRLSTSFVQGVRINFRFLIQVNDLMSTTRTPLRPKLTYGLCLHSPPRIWASTNHDWNTLRALDRHVLSEWKASPSSPGNMHSILGVRHTFLIEDRARSAIMRLAASRWVLIHPNENIESPDGYGCTMVQEKEWRPQLMHNCDVSGKCLITSII